MEKEKDDSGGRNFDTPVDALFCRGSRGVREGSGCVESDCAVSLSFAAARRVVPRLGFREVGEWWWFENSRAYLYYFFIVNDCQSVLRPARVFRVWVPGGRSNGTGFLRTVRFPYKRMSIFLFESHMLVLFMKGFFVEGSILAQDERWRRA